MVLSQMPTISNGVTPKNLEQLQSELPASAPAERSSRLGPIPNTDASKDALNQLLEQKWGLIIPKGVGKLELAWLLRIAAHPKADETILKSLVTKLDQAAAAPRAINTELLKAAVVALNQKLGARDGLDGPSTQSPASGGSTGAGTVTTSDPVSGEPLSEAMLPSGGIKLAARVPDELKSYLDEPRTLNKTMANDFREVNEPNDVFRHNKLVNTAALFTEYKPDAEGNPQPSIKPGREALAAKLQTPFAVGADRHLNRLPELDGAKGQRIIYVGSSPEEKKRLAQVVAYFISRGIGIDKNMVHVITAMGGPIAEALKGEHGVQDGVTHGGALEIVNLDPSEGPLSMAQIEAKAADLKLGRYDKPVNYGDPTTGDEPNYWFYMVLFDPSTIEWQSDVKPTQKEFSGWMHATQLWRVIDLCTVGFSREYPIANLQTYKNNPVEITSADKLPPMLNEMANAFDASNPTMMASVEKLKWYAEYCEEGKTNTRIMGLNAPLNQKSVDAGMISADALKTFQKIESVYTSVYRKPDGSLDKESMYKNPSLGYDKLKAEGMLHEVAYNSLKKTGYIDKPFVLNDPDLDGWMKYQPKGVEATPGVDGFGMPYKAVTMVGLARMVLSNNLPRRELAAGFAQQLTAVKDGNDEAAKRELNEELAQSGAPSIEAYAAVAAAKFQAETLEQLKPDIYEKLRFNELNDAGKATIDGFFNETLELIGSPELALNREMLFEKLEELDNRLRKLELFLDGTHKSPLQYVSPNMIPALARGMPGLGGVGMEHFAMGVCVDWKEKPEP